MPAGRAGESASLGLAENLQQLGFETNRLKTGTPACLDCCTVDFHRLEPQHGDEEDLTLLSLNYTMVVAIAQQTSDDTKAEFPVQYLKDWGARHSLLLSNICDPKKHLPGLPERLQLPLLRTLHGQENCSILRPAYAVKYDYLPAYRCSRSPMTKKIEGLFFSDQINGITGYEEAAAQVFMSYIVFLSPLSLLPLSSTFMFLDCSP
ncbi:MnmG, N-terminal domain [Dillenia turbinata]|uniref:MnmG, N-terminal domain n=1 Tax=Dillenia turbinata TaxID=194707 RepID=A0AAN8UXX8_9MAGN